MKNIAIDGPAGAGKSTLAVNLARALDYCYVDTGAIYRTIAWHFSMCGIGPRDKDNIHRFLGDALIEVHYVDGAQRMLLNGRDVTDELRTPELSAFASAVSANGEVRSYLLQMQRALARRHNCVMDGRDIGTVVLPDATVKIFLTATPEARATRRWKEYQAKGIDTPYEEVLADVKQRDYQDTHRAAAPLKQADDAVLLDTSELDFEQSLAAMKQIIAEKVNKTVKGYYITS